MEKVCFLFGHRNSPCDIEDRIEAAVLRHYNEYGVHNFIVGNRGDFDAMAAAAVKRLKKRCPDISLQLLIAYHPAERPVEPSAGYDGTYYPLLGNVPRQYAIVRANREMVSQADAIICYVTHAGNTRDLLAYAYRCKKKRDLRIENLGERNL